MKVKDILITVLVISLAVMTIKTCKLEKTRETLQDELNLSNNSLSFLMDHPVIKTDTVYRDPKTIRPPEPFQDEVKPSKIIQPKWNPSDTAIVNHNPPPQLLLTDSIIGFNLNKNRFTLTFQNPFLGNHQSEFNIRPDEYQYTWANGTLTAKKLSVWRRLEVKPFTSLSYRPIHNLWDVEVGLSFKTKSLNYTLGLNGFYYPRWQSSPGLDAQIRITYNF